MCTYIAAALLTGSNAQAVAEIADAHGLGWEPFSNRHLTEQAPGSTWFLTSRKHCDCGTALGASAVSRRANDPQDQVPKLKERGWSDAKIARWLADKRGAEERHERSRLQRAEDDATEVLAWLRFLTAVLTAGVAKSVSILLHDYSGPIEGERIAITRREIVGLADLTSRRLSEMEADVLYRCG